MPKRQPIMGAIVFAAWLYLSVLYYTLVHLPPPLNIGVNVVAAIAASLAIALMPRSQYLLQLYVLAFALAFCMSSLQISFDQPAFTADFILFSVLHLTLLGVAIGAGSALFRGDDRTPGQPQRDGLVNALVYVFIALAAFVALSKGVRLSGFLEGVKTDGNLYKIGGLSGLQGMIMVFLLCCFSRLNGFNRVILIVAAGAVAVLDVKRGEIIRLVLFLFFYVVLWLSVSGISRRRLLLIGGLGVMSLVVLVVGGELRQGLYSSQFSVSTILNSRVNVTAIDWFYGYFGINASVLQQYFEALQDPVGYFPQLFHLALDSRDDIFGLPVSINGFNAGTAFSVFAGNSTILPSADFIFFCLMMVGMAALASLVPVASLQAFLMLQVFGFVFGNQLILPYYVVGYIAAAGYLAVCKRPSDSKSQPDFA